MSGAPLLWGFEPSRKRRRAPYPITQRRDVPTTSRNSARVSDPRRDASNTPRVGSGVSLLVNALNLAFKPDVPSSVRYSNRRAGWAKSLRRVVIKRKAPSQTETPFATGEIVTRAITL